MDVYEITCQLHYIKVLKKHNIKLQKHSFILHNICPMLVMLLEMPTQTPGYRHVPEYGKKVYKVSGNIWNHLPATLYDAMAVDNLKLRLYFVLCNFC